jgi:exosortase A
MEDTDALTTVPGAEGGEVNSVRRLRLAVSWPFLTLVVALLVAYADYIGWMVGQWWKSDYYSHGPLIPIISGYLVYRAAGRLTALPRRGSRLGLWFVLGCQALFLVAEYLNVHFAQGFALVGTIWGLVWWLGGWEIAKAVAFPVAYLLFMVPLARLLVDVFAQPLQLYSAAFAGAVAKIIGMNVVVEGTSLHIPGYTFEVAIACSGLKSVIAMSALGALMAYMAEAAMARRVALFALSLPVALVANGVRIWLTLLLGASIGPAAAEGFFHKASGIIVFVIAVLGLLLAGRLLGCQKMRDDI